MKGPQAEPETRHHWRGIGRNNGGVRFSSNPDGAPEGPKSEVLVGIVALSLAFMFWGFWQIQSGGSESGIFSEARFAICGFMLSNGTLVVLNKVLVTYATVPAFLLLCQCGFSALVLLLGHLIGAFALDRLGLGEVLRFSAVPLAVLSTIYANVQVLSTTNIETLLIFRPAVLFVLMFSDYLLLGRELPSLWSLGCVGAILACLLLYLWAEAGLNVNTWVWLCIWYVMTIFDSAYVKHSIDTQSMSTATRTFWTNLVMSCAIAPLAMAEVGRQAAEPFLSLRDGPLPLLVLFASCIFGFSISFCGFGARKAVAAASFEFLGMVCKLLSIVLNVALWNRHASQFGLAALLGALFAASFYKEAPLRREEGGKVVESAK